MTTRDLQMEVATDVSLWRYQTGARSPYCLRRTSSWWAQFLSLPCGILLLYSLAACTRPLFPPDVTKALDPSLQMD
ncbi:MAG TPA: hypothetical protein PLO50_10875, partial [Nitrospira sp.]|nr:hypothetical protein [Nitrospira sp.]